MECQHEHTRSTLPPLPSYRLHFGMDGIAKPDYGLMEDLAQMTARLMMQDGSALRLRFGEVVDPDEWNRITRFRLNVQHSSPIHACHNDARWYR